jgi:hypothetical protein
MTEDWDNPRPRNFTPRTSAPQGSPPNPPKGGSSGKSASAAVGCICPPGANIACLNSDCPRRGWLTPDEARKMFAWGVP